SSRRLRTSSVFSCMSCMFGIGSCDGNRRIVAFAARPGHANDPTNPRHASPRRAAVPEAATSCRAELRPPLCRSERARIYRTGSLARAPLCDGRRGSERPAHHQLVARPGFLGLQFVFVVVAVHLVAEGVE